MYLLECQPDGERSRAHFRMRAIAPVEGKFLPPQGIVTEVRSDSSVLARLYCPGCEPDADPFAEILDVHWCDAHMPARDGSDDGTVTTTIVVSGSAEAGGEGNRRWCEFFHRDARRAPVAPAPRRRRRHTADSVVTPPDDGVI